MLRSDCQKIIENDWVFGKRKGYLEIYFLAFWPKKVKRNSISEMKSFWMCRRGGNLLQRANLPIVKFFRALSIFGSCGDSKEWNVLDLRCRGGVSRFWFGVRPTPPGGHISRNSPALGGTPIARPFWNFFEIRFFFQKKYI